VPVLKYIIIMSREPKLMVVIGKKGVGKTFLTTKAMKGYVVGNPAKGVQGRKVLILDVNDEYTEFKPIALKDVQLFSLHPSLEIRRVRPFHLNGTKMTLNELADTLGYILEHYRNGLFLIEDVNKYVSDHLPNDLIGAICTNRHTGLDIILHYQSIGRIPTKVWQNLNILRYHKCTDSVDRHKTKFEDKIEYLSLAESMINFNYYKLNNKRYYLTIDIDDEKIYGNYTDKLWDLAVEEFVANNYNSTIAPLLRSINTSTGKKSHNYKSAYQAVKSRLNQYRG
jgi:hypothetical protein